MNKLIKIDAAPSFVLSEEEMLQLRGGGIPTIEAKFSNACIENKLNKCSDCENEYKDKCNKCDKCDKCDKCAFICIGEYA